MTTTTPPPTAPPVNEPPPPPIKAWRGGFTSGRYTKLVDPRVRWGFNFRNKSLDLTFSTNVNGERASSFLIEISFKACKAILLAFLTNKSDPI
jgi:hypothetical protein